MNANALFRSACFLTLSNERKGVKHIFMIIAPHDRKDGSRLRVVKH
jgi:hypothetical protein